MLFFYSEYNITDLTIYSEWTTVLQQEKRGKPKTTWSQTVKEFFFLLD